jgi:glycosyltransferase involved in cell wall biosynthesis
MMNLSAPAITAVIPTQGRIELIGRTMESLCCAASRYPGKFELIVVDSSQSDDAERIEKSCPMHNAIYVAGPQSVRKKRNIGAKQARGEVLLFIDSDCLASPDLLLEHARIYKAHPEVAGVCGTTEFSEHRGIHWSVIEQAGLLDSFSFAKKYDRVQWCTTSNFSVRRAVFWSEGGFDEKFPFRLGGDDLDLTFRITSKGWLILSNPEAVVFHASETWAHFAAVRERAFRWGRMGYHIFNKHQKLQYLDLPKPTLVLVVMLIVYFAKSGFSSAIASFWVLAVPISLFLIAEIAFFNKRGVGWRRLLIPFSWVYVCIYRTGLILEFLLNRDIRFLFCKTIYSTYQLTDEWPLNVAKQWTMMICWMTGWFLWMAIR